ncbi:E3 ubiquitin-protein ligase RNF216-like [Physella acuta]|uniref:E3 ubiquitin-protein ligase RNF216-like n=1 Tax=Physella acuta TaxID=109671 RepID=UPI0027DE2E17|nr:E3 ubiquitin-protein ligase RNF216-like [Physella acuta]
MRCMRTINLRTFSEMFERLGMTESKRPSSSDGCDVVKKKPKLLTFDNEIDNGSPLLSEEKGPRTKAQTALLRELQPGADQLVRSHDVRQPTTSSACSSSLKQSTTSVPMAVPSTTTTVDPRKEGSRDGLVKQTSSTSSHQDPSAKDGSLDRIRPKTVELTATIHFSRESFVEDLHQDVATLKNLFPDCDSQYLYQQLSSMKPEGRVDLLASDMLENKNYPLAVKSKMSEQIPDVTVEEFSKKFPEPVKMFSAVNTDLSPLYRQHVTAYLNNKFRKVKASNLIQALETHKFHLYPTVQSLRQLTTKQGATNAIRKRKKRKWHEIPKDRDERFSMEKWFIENEQMVLAYQQRKEEEKKAMLRKAQQSGQSYECCCCLNECLFEEMTSCPDAHIFCRECLVSYVQTAFSNMKTRFPCLTGYCDQDVALTTLQTVLPSNLFSKIVRRIQEEEVLHAKLPDLVVCPFCPYATIMPDHDDKVLKCLNPDCLRESCRLCKEPSHIPLRCDEVEKRHDVQMRTFIENSIAEAVMRTCHVCGKRFVKDAGCNKMTCACGATSCYVCKQNDIDYDHFKDNENCVERKAAKIHFQDVAQAATAAKEKYLKDHPEAANITHHVDVRKMIEDCKADFFKKNK